MLQQSEVLIIGAGPTGLTLACVLLRYGIAFRIIDKKATATTTSNALGLHARTLEIFEDLGIVEPFLKQGKSIQQICLHSKNKTLAQVDLSKINSAYNFLLILPQSQTETLLSQHLESHGIRIERDTELVELIKQQNSFSARIKYRGTESTLNPNYIVACDGAHSRVRELTGVVFKGEVIKEQFALIDANIDTDLSLTKMHVFLGARQLFAAFPMPSGQVRLVTNLDSTKKLTLDEIDFRQLATTRSFGRIRIKDSSWNSTFWIHSNSIEKMRLNNVFFCGDSAHTHSPIGGQGMNTGIQDAYNLGWKLAYVLQGKMPADRLESYAEERLPIAQELVKSTSAFTKLMLTKNPLSNLLKQHVMPILIKRPSFNHKMAARLAMLSIHYPKSSAINYKSVISNLSPQPGDLIPEITLPEPLNFSRHLADKLFCLLIFCGKKPTPQQLGKILNFCTLINSDYADKIHYRIICNSALGLKQEQWIDTDFSLHQAFNVVHPALCLVRPDKYIAYASAFLNLKGLTQFLQQQLS